MATLQIYDSQGQPIHGEAGGENQQVKDFFFDGVRLAVDANRNEMFCFFRARDNETARSEQYYAKYSYQTRSEMGNIFDAVKSRIEGEYGMILDTENNDTRFFELLGSSNSGSVPNNSSDLDDVMTLLSEYQSARIGVGSYDEAYGLFGKLSRNADVNKVAVSDNATGRSLSAYDLVIEKGDYFGVELLGDTEEKVESLRERRRAALESEHETDDDTDPISGLMGAALFVGVGVGIVLAVLYGSCLGLNMALVGDLPGATCGPSLGDISADATGNGSQEVRITGVINGLSDTNATVNVTVVHENGTKLFSNPGSRKLNSSGGFNFTIQPGSNETNLAPGNYTARVEFRGKQVEDNFTVENASGTAATQTADNNTTDSTPDSTGTERGTIESISVPDTVNGSATSVRINGTTSNLTSGNISIQTNITSADGTSLLSTASKNVTVAADGNFTLSVLFDASGTDGPYEVTVRYNGSRTNATFGSGPSAEPKLEHMSVLDVDKSQAEISLRGNISNFTGDSDQVATIRVKNGTDTLYNRQTAVVVSEDGKFGTFEVTISISENPLTDGNYTLLATYKDGTPAKETFNVTTPS